MAVSGGLPYGLQAMLKDGYQMFSGVNEAVVKNIEACKELSAITKTSLGPNGMNKIIINHIDKLFVTSDCGTIINELDVFHPAAKLVAMAAKSQQQEIGDGTNSVISISGELLKLAEGLLREGLHVAEVADGFEKASRKALESLESMVIEGSGQVDVRDKEQVEKLLYSSVSSKQFGSEKILSPLVAEACIAVCPSNQENFDVDNVRVCKIVGGGLADSSVVQGMVIKRESEGSVKVAEDAKVVVYAQGVDTSGTETKGTVLIKSGEELENYSSSEEKRIEGYIKALADLGIKVIVSGSSIGEMAMHFIEKYEMMVVKITSKFELKRFCRATGAAALANFRPPTPEELGYAKRMSVQEIGGTSCTVLQQGGAKEKTFGGLATIVLRGSTDAGLDDVEHAIDNAVNNYRVICKDSRTVPGGGACEIALSRIIMDFGKKEIGLDQYAIAKFAQALEVIPCALADTSGFNGPEVVAALHAEHAAGNSTFGIDVATGAPKDLRTDKIQDLYICKWWVLKLASDAVLTVLKVDQIIMARAAGGPKPKQGGDWDED